MTSNIVVCNKYGRVNTAIYALQQWPASRRKWFHLMRERFANVIGLRRMSFPVAHVSISATRALKRADAQN